MSRVEGGGGGFRRKYCTIPPVAPTQVVRKRNGVVGSGEWKRYLGWKGAKYVDGKY